MTDSAPGSHSQTEHIYLPVTASIISITNLTPGEKLFKLRLDNETELAHKPGQFIQLSITGCEEAPISLASSPTRKGCFDLGIRRVGTLTSAMHLKKAGDTVGIRGPFGKPFDIPSMEGKDLILVSGGCGLAPLRSLIQYIEDNRECFGKVTLLHGARNPAGILFKNDLASWEDSGRFSCLTTVEDNGGDGCYDGTTGLITSLLPSLELEPERTEAIIVGPPVMYKPVISALKEKGMRASQIVLSLERQMRCGVGKCGHCAIEHLYCCQDGPVFRLSEIEGISGIF